MSEQYLTKDEIIEKLLNVIIIQEKIFSRLKERIQGIDTEVEMDWSSIREKIMRKKEEVLRSYSYSLQLPPNELGVASLSVTSNLMKMQHALGEILVMLDMLHDKQFAEVFKDAINNIANKVHQEFQALISMIQVCSSSPEEINACLKEVIRLEREIDEDNIIICRQISVATGGDSDFVCYLLRKIIKELEHVSDYIKEVAEILSEF